MLNIKRALFAMKILLIEDNRLLIDSIKNLLAELYIVDFEQQGHAGIDRACAIQYGLIVLDLNLPDMEGYEVCYKIRQAKITTPILVLTAKKDAETLVKLLNCGADDYMTKPFSGEVLKARITALLRRSTQLTDEKIIDIHDLTVNITRRQVWRSGVNIPLRRKEFDILEYLITNHGRTLTRAMILDHVWEAGTEGWNNTVDVHIKHLRDKIDRPFNSKPLIKTAYGVGYLVDSAT
jgi:DNA-binding response OmpR family regulator